MEARLDRFKIKNYLETELDKIEKLRVTIKQEDLFPGFSE
jgi:hypothetical protein